MPAARRQKTTTTTTTTTIVNGSQTTRTTTIVETTTTFTNILEGDLFLPTISSAPIPSLANMPVAHLVISIHTTDQEFETAVRAFPGLPLIVGIARTVGGNCAVFFRTQADAKKAAKHKFCYETHGKSKTVDMVVKERSKIATLLKNPLKAMARFMERYYERVEELERASQADVSDDDEAELPGPVNEDRNSQRDSEEGAVTVEDESAEEDVDRRGPEVNHEEEQREVANLGGSAPIVIPIVTLDEGTPPHAVVGRSGVVRDYVNAFERRGSTPVSATSSVFPQQARRPAQSFSSANALSPLNAPFALRPHSPALNPASQSSTRPPVTPPRPRIRPRASSVISTPPGPSLAPPNFGAPRPRASSAAALSPSDLGVGPSGHHNSPTATPARAVSTPSTPRHRASSATSLHPRSPREVLAEQRYSDAGTAKRAVFDNAEQFRKAESAADQSHEKSVEEKERDRKVSFEKAEKAWKPGYYRPSDK